jgi:hypothetical protein
MTDVVLLVLVIGLGVLVFLLLGAQIEMYRDINDLRETGGLIDRPLPINLGRRAHGRPSDYGLPAELDSAASMVLLILSDKCATCRSIAASISGAVPQNVFVMLEPGSAGPDAELTSAYDFDPTRLVIDRTREITYALGIDVTPAAVVIRNGRFETAQTIPSTRLFQALVKSTRTLKAGELTEQMQAASERADDGDRDTAHSH